MWNSNLWDLGYEFGVLFGLNPTIEAFSCWLDLSHPRLLYKDAWVIDFHERRTKISATPSHKPVVPLYF